MNIRNLRLSEVIRITGLSRSEIYRRVKDGRFPIQRRISHRVAVWKSNEIEAWVAATNEHA